MIYIDGHYTGEWKEDKRDGWGKMTYEDDIEYIGEWKEDKKEGKEKLR